MSYLAGTAVYYDPDCINKFQLLQLNVMKKDIALLSLLNDESLKDFSILAITEPNSWRNKGKTIVTLAGHQNWIKCLPTAQNKGDWAYRSMIWARGDLEVEQLPMDSGDLTAILVRLQDCTILVFLVYVPGEDQEALLQTLNVIQQTIRQTQQRIGTRTDIIVAGDFNRHDQL